MADPEHESAIAPLTSFTVAPGRTLETDAGSRREGDTVMLDPGEGRRLQALGFLLNADGSRPLALDGGPPVNVENGAVIPPRGV